MVVDIAPNQGYYSKQKNPTELQGANDPPEPPRVKDPPNPRMPVMSGASGSEVRTSAVQQKQSAVTCL